MICLGNSLPEMSRLLMLSLLPSCTAAADVSVWSFHLKQTQMATPNWPMMRPSLEEAALFRDEILRCFCCTADSLQWLGSVACCSSLRLLR